MQTEKPEKLTREELKLKLRSKMQDKKIRRCSKQKREKFLTSSLDKMGIDREKLMESVELLKKQKK
jgi:hypothetical protein